VIPVLEKPYISVSINSENIGFLHFTNGGHTRKSIMAAPMFLRIKRSIVVVQNVPLCINNMATGCGVTG
jgi:hypothetical protein